MTKEWSKFKDDRIIDGKIRKVIVDIIGDVFNRNPTKDELKGCKKYPGKNQSVIMTLPYKEEYLLEFIRHFYHKEGRVPKAADFSNNKKYPTFHIYQQIFETWNNAIIKGGLQPNRSGPTGYTDKELLESHIRFYEENGRPAIATDFINNLIYPGFLTYQRFEGWNNSLKIVGLDIDSMISYGIIENNIQKGRLGEILVRNHFSENDKVIDLAGGNPSKHICDGIDPGGHYYDVKTAELSYKCKFNLLNENIDNIEYLYCLAFNEDFSKLLYAWRIPISDFMEKMGNNITIGIKNTYTFNIENMKKYEITEKIMLIFEEWKNCEKWTKEEIIAEAKRKLRIYVENKKR